MSHLTGGRVWVLILGALALSCLIVGFIALAVGVANQNGWCEGAPVGSDGVVTAEGCVKDTSGIWWGGALAAIGLLLAGFAGVAGAVVWTLESHWRSTTAAQEPEPVNIDRP